MTHLQCLNNETKKHFVDIGNKITSVLYHVNDDVSSKDLNNVIPGVCCAVSVVLLDIKNDLKTICDGRSPSDTDQFVINFIKAILSDAIDIVCGKYNTIEVCKETQPNITAGIEESLTERKSSYENTLVVPLLDIINKLDSEVNLKD